jgi:peptidoglycan/xylan/chitin deacetylase (PgdA/CDA1 family)
VGNHTYSHLKGFGTQSKQYFEDIEIARQLIDSELFRPPYGRILPKQVEGISKNYSIILWDVLSFDYNRKLRGEKIVQNVIQYTRPGSIIVFHDSAKARKNLYYALPVVLEHFSKKGYEMASIPMKKKDVELMRNHQ